MKFKQLINEKFYKWLEVTNFNGKRETIEILVNPRKAEIRKLIKTDMGWRGAVDRKKNIYIWRVGYIHDLVVPKLQDIDVRLAYEKKDRVIYGRKDKQHAEFEDKERNWYDKNIPKLANGAEFDTQNWIKI